MELQVMKKTYHLCEKRHERINYVNISPSTKGRKHYDKLFSKLIVPDIH